MEHNFIIITSSNKISSSVTEQMVRAARRAMIIAEAKKQLALGNYIS